MKNKTIYRVPLLLLLIMSCSARDEDALKTQWKYSAGHHFGDWLDLERNPVQLRNDTLLRNAVPFAKLIGIRKGYFGYPTKMELEALANRERGFYVDKGN